LGEGSPWKSREFRGGGILVGVVVSDVGFPFLLGFVFIPKWRESRAGIRNEIPSLGFTFGRTGTDDFGRLSRRPGSRRIPAFQLREPTGDGSGGVLVGVVVSDVGSPPLPGLGLALESRKTGNLIGRPVLVNVVISDVLSPLGPRFWFRGR